MKEQLPKFLVTDHVPEGFVEGLQALGFEVTHIAKLEKAVFHEAIGEYAGLVINTSLIADKDLLDKASKLHYILRPGSGLDNIDLAYAKSKGILVFNSPEANADAVAEHVIGLVLGLMNNIPKAYEQFKKGQWVRQPNNGTLLKGKTVGIMGYGHTGSALAKKLSGFEVRTLAYDKYKTGFGNEYVAESSMETLFAEADILSLHIPLTPETRSLVNKTFINKFWKPIYLINTSRGPMVDLEVATYGLKAGKIAGLALDVLENEKPESWTAAENRQVSGLLSAGNVIITPHIAGWTHESRREIFMLVLKKFGKYLLSKGEEGKNPQGF